MSNQGNAENRPAFSVVVPMYNEAENLPGTLFTIADALKPLGRPFEIIAVDDGSTDNTEEILREQAAIHSWLKPVSYVPNRGRGYAQRKGFAAAEGRLILTTDADLSYDPEHLVSLIETLDLYPEIDFAVGSPYMAGGGTKNVPFFRLLISRVANLILGYAMSHKLKTVTGILRAYRREVINSIELESDGKEINLEIVSKAIAAGFRAQEVPAVLTGRKKGKSKLILKATVASHLLFSFFERPSLLFGAVGTLLTVLGLAGGGYLVYLWQTGNLNPVRPLVTLIVILLISGLQISLFGFLGTQLVRIHRELFRIQRENKQLAQKLDTLVDHPRRMTPELREPTAVGFENIDQ